MDLMRRGYLLTMVHNRFTSLLRKESQQTISTICIVIAINQASHNRVSHLQSRYNRGCSSNNPCSSKKKTKPNPGAVTRRNFSRPQPQPTRSVHP